VQLTEKFHDAVRPDVDKFKHGFDEAVDVNIVTECFSPEAKTLSLL
jgi:hypothetical protein